MSIPEDIRALRKQRYLMTYPTPTDPIGERGESHESDINQSLERLSIYEEDEKMARALAEEFANDQQASPPRPARMDQLLPNQMPSPYIWMCRCTFVNQNDSRACGFCGTPRMY